MTTYARRHPLVVALLCSSAMLSSGARRFHRLAVGLGERLEKRRCDRIARREQDATITTDVRHLHVPAAEMERIAFASHPLFNPFRID